MFDADGDGDYAGRGREGKTTGWQCGLNAAF